MAKFNGEIALVTGSARGIGFAVAKKLLEDGAHVIILDIMQDAVDETVAELSKIRKEVCGYTLNVTDSAAIETTFKQIVEKHKRIDILVNNAGVTKDNLLMRMKEADWDFVLDVNLKGTFLCTQKVTRQMMKQRAGAIVNVASVIGVMGNAGQANYAASKGGVIAFTKSAAKELAARNIRINAIAPGFIETEMTKKLSDDVRQSMADAIPLKRFGQTEDVANLISFLASEEASYISGQTINIDGGMVM